MGAVRFSRKSSVSRLAPLSVLCVAALVAGCAIEEKDITAGWTPQKIYAEARDEMDSHMYDKAIGLYEKLEGRAAGTVLGQQAQLEKAYAQYKNSEQILAIATLDRFIKLNPASPALDYALYLKGVVNFNDDQGLLSRWLPQDLSERDQQAAKDSFNSFKELVTRFPDSKYAEDARLRMQYIVNNLAQSEIKVAQFYLAKGAYVAAINRAQSTLSEYPDIPATEDALVILVKSYDALGMTQLRDDARRVLETNFPKHRSSTGAAQPAAPATGQEAAPVKKPWYKFW